MDSNPFESFYDGDCDHSYMYPKQYVRLSLPESSSDSNTKGEGEPLSGPLPPPRPHPLTNSQCADVHRESKLISCCAIG